MNSNKAPLISIVLPFYNAKSYLLQSATSAMQQSYRELEIICIDDGSTDQSLEVLTQLSRSDRRLQILRSDKNQGAAAARNRGIDAAKGSFLFFLDADDSIPANAIETLLAAAPEGDTDLVVGKYLWLKSADEASLLGSENAKPANPSITDVHSSKELQKVPGCHCCNLYRRSLLERENLRYNENLSYGEDQLFQAQAILKARKVAMIESVVYFYHHYRSGSVTRGLPTLKNLIDDIDYQEIMATEFTQAGLGEAGRRFLENWSYPIREYWSKIPVSLDQAEASILFEHFRNVIMRNNVKPWNNSTPHDHRVLVDLIMAGEDKAAYHRLRDLSNT